MPVEGPEAQLDPVAGLSGRDPLEKVSSGDVETAQRTQDRVGHEPGPMGQHTDRKERLGQGHDDVVPHRAQVTTLGDPPSPGDQAIEDWDEGRQGQRAEDQAGPCDRRGTRQGPGGHREQERRGRREATPEIVDHPPATVHGDRNPLLPPGGVVCIAQDPGQELPVSPDPAMIATCSDLVVRGELLEEIHIGQKRCTCKQALEQVMAEECVLGDPSFQGRLERIDVVDPLSGVRSLLEEVLIHIGDCGCVGVHSTGPRDDALIGGGSRAGR